MSSFLSYCWLATSSVQSGNSPPTSGINNSCSPRELPLTGYSLDRLERIVWNMRKILADQKFMKYSDQPIWQHIPCYFFSLGWRVWTSAVHLDMLQCIKLLPWDWPTRYVHLTFEQAYLIKWLIRADKLFLKTTIHRNCMINILLKIALHSLPKQSLLLRIEIMWQKWSRNSSIHLKWHEKHHPYLALLVSLQARHGKHIFAKFWDMPHLLQVLLVSPEFWQNFNYSLMCDI